MKLVRRLPKVRFTHNILAIKHRSSLMSGDLHGNGLSDTGTDKVPYGCSPKIVPNHARDLGLSARKIPHLSKVLELIAIESTLAEIREKTGNAPVKSSPWLGPVRLDATVTFQVLV